MRESLLRNSSMDRMRNFSACRSISCFEERGLRRASSLERAARWRRGKLHLQFACDRRGDFVLNRENVSHLAVVALRPEVCAIDSVDELHGHANASACSAYAALQNRTDAERLGDGADVFLFAAKSKRRRTCDTLSPVIWASRLMSSSANPSEK